MLKFLTAPNEWSVRLLRPGPSKCQIISWRGMSTVVYYDGAKTVVHTAMKRILRGAGPF